MQKLGAPLLELEERSTGTRRLTVSDMGESFLASRVSFGITRIDAAEGSETLIRHDPRPFQNLAVLTYEQRTLLAATEREIEEHVRDLMERMAVRLQPGFQKISLHVFETARATGSRQFCAFLYRDEQNWIYFGVADDDILDQHMYQLLKVMRFQLREFLRSVADSWQSVFASAEFLAAVTPDLPLKTAEDRRILITDLRRRSDAAPTEATNLFDGGAREENEDDVSFSDALCAGDGVRWRGTCGEIAYRCGANLTLTAPFCEHRHFARFARYVLLLHSMCVNVFVSAAVTIGFDIHNADPAAPGDAVDTHRVNQFMRTNSYWIAGATAFFIYAYMYIVRLVLLANMKANDKRKPSFWKSCCSLFERIGHIPIIIASVLYVILALGMIAYFFRFFTAFGAFVCCFFATIGAAFFYLFGHRIGFLVETQCGWHALRRYCMLWSCCEQCRWAPESMLGMCMGKYLPCCAPEESHKTINAVETSCCFWSLPCFAVCPTRLFDECCPSNVSAERVCRYATAGFAIVTCLAGLGWLWIPTAGGATQNDPISMDDFYTDVVFVVTQTALSQVGTWALEIAALVLSMLAGLGMRCLWGICIDCGYHGFVSQFEEDASSKPSIDIRSSNDYTQFVDGTPQSPMATKAVPK